MQFALTLNFVFHLICILALRPLLKETFRDFNLLNKSIGNQSKAWLNVWTGENESDVSQLTFLPTSDSSECLEANLKFAHNQTARLQLQLHFRTQNLPSQLSNPKDDPRWIYFYVFVICICLSIGLLVHMYYDGLELIFFFYKEPEEFDDDSYFESVKFDMRSIAIIYLILDIAFFLAIASWAAYSGKH